MRIRSFMELARSSQSRRLMVLVIAMFGVLIAGSRLDFVAHAEATGKPVSSPRFETPSPTPTPAAQSMDDQHAILSFLSDVINWYQHLAVEEQLVTEPSETLYLADDRQMADEVLTLAFKYARGRAAAIAAAQQVFANQSNVESPAQPSDVEPRPNTRPTSTPSPLSQSSLSAHLVQFQAQVARAQAKVQTLKAQSNRAKGQQRDQLASQLVAAEGELALARSRIDGVNEMLKFVNTEQAGHPTSGLIAQIDELEHSVQAGNEPAKAVVAPDEAATRPANQPETSGILELAGQLLALQNKDQALDSTIALTQSMDQRIAAMRAPLLDRIRAIDQQGLTLGGNVGAGDLSAVQLRRQQFQALVQERKLLISAILPLAKTNVILNLYTHNLERWLQAIDRRSDQVLRSLVIRLIVLGGLLGLIAAGAIIWRQLTFRYIHDARHRHRILQVRTLTVIVLVMVVILFNFSNEIGALATVMGLATAGIAFALQNVILSVAGYFFLSGRYGVKVGDRIQLGGVYGTVIDIGLVKLTMMELSGEGNFRQPTGRVVVFANSIVFQASGNFFKQAPGINFVWNELRLTLAPDCDYELAEKLLTDTVNDVVEHYREDLRREYRQRNHALNVWFEPPESHSNMLLSADGVRLSIRYPVEVRRAVEINDAISRRILNVINHEPRLRLVSPSTPTIQAVAAPPGDCTPEAAISAVIDTVKAAGETVTKP
ncbi:MAG: mechanosensitive ion channel [Candidatus Binataceae bacterium]|nr:mechanosensitive ion channel [Candidatus Binataceae bacterium]